MVFQNMQRNGVPPSKSTYRALYKALRYAGGRNGRISNKTAARFAIDAVTSNSKSKSADLLFSYDGTTVTVDEDDIARLGRRRRCRHERIPQHPRTKANATI